MSSSHTTTGIIWLCLGVLVFSLQDAIIKQMSGAYPVTEAVAIRSAIAVPLLLVIAHFEVGIRAVASPRFWWLVGRAGIMLVSYTAYYMAFPALPLADAVALYFTVPLFVTVLAGPFLGERTGLMVWLAVIIGFCGVIIMLQPGTGVFEPAAFLSLLAAATYGISMLMARKMGAVESASVLSFYQNGIYLLGAVVMAGVFYLLGVTDAAHPSLRFLVRPWITPSTGDLLLMGACGVIAAVGMMFLTQAYRVAEVSRVAPFEYTGILWAPLWGFVFFAEVPRWTTVAGAVLIVIAGLIALRKPADRGAEPRRARKDAIDAQDTRGPDCHA